MENKISLKSLTLSIFFVLIMLASQSHAELISYPKSKVLNEDLRTEDESFQVATGVVRRLNSLLNPESEISITGRKESKTLSSIPRRNVAEITDFYLGQFNLADQNRGEVLFECEGRSCGPSTYWANKVFKNSLLYGPEQYQRYFVIHVKAPQEYYLILYIAQRATGQVYIQEEIIWVPQFQSLHAQIARALRERNTYLLPEVISNDLVAALLQLVTDDEDSKYILVVHGSIEGDESSTHIIEKTFAKKNLNNLGIYNAGPILNRSESQKKEYLVGRIELVKLSF